MEIKVMFATVQQTDKIPPSGQSVDSEFVLQILNLIFSASGAIIILSVIILIIVMIIVFVPGARKGGWKINAREGTLERTPELSASESIDDEADTQPGPQETASPNGLAKMRDGRGVKSDAEVEKEDDNSDPYIAMIIACDRRDEEALEKAFQRYKEQSSEEEAWSFREKLRLDMGAIGALQNLIDLEIKNTEWTEPSRHLAFYYKDICEFETAHEHLDTGLSRAADAAKKYKLKFLKADVFKDQDKTPKALDLLQEFTASLSEDQSYVLVETLGKLSKIYKELNDHERMAILLEEALIIDPQNTELRFYLAYEYSSREDTNLLSVYHYQVLIKQDPSKHIVFNNLGTTLGELGLKIEEIKNLKRGIGGGTDYPAGNLAIVLAKAGFIDDAEKYIRELPKELKGGERARFAIDYIEKTKKENRVKVEKVNNSVMIVRDLMREAVKLNKDNKVKSLSADDLSGEWTVKGSDEGTVHLAGNGSEFSGEWRRPSKIFRLTGKKTDSMISLKAVKIKHKRSGLGLLIAGSSTASSEEWIDSTLLSSEEYHIWLLVKNECELKGAEIKGMKAVPTLLAKQ